MLSIIDWSKTSELERDKLLQRPLQAQVMQTQVADIIAMVRNAGDQALINFTQEFDQVMLSTLTISTAEATISSSALQAIQAAIKTITHYHQAIMPQPITVNTAPGITIQQILRPINRVGLYIPGGGQTPLISSVLMQAIPAKIAGCPLRVLCTPPNLAGQIDNNLLVAARLCGIETVYPIGGAQAIAAMAYGTASIPKVDKIFGPGNAYVTTAKQLVSQDPLGAAIDLPAGPSELMVIADENANPQWVAADLLTQAEHGIDSQVILLCETMRMAVAVNAAIVLQIQRLKRAEIIAKALQYARILVCQKQSTQLAIINQYAPEHLLINRRDAADWVQHIQACGTIFLGAWAAETMGDYITGSNHVLPTYGYAKSHSGLNPFDFMKAISVQSIDEESVRTLGPLAIDLAKLEGLDAHAAALEIRLGEK